MIVTDWHPCTQTSEQLKVFRWVQLSKQHRNQLADLAARADGVLPSTSRTSCTLQEFRRWISMGLQEFLLFFILQSKAQREWLWPITFMLHSSRSTLHVSTDRNLGYVHKDCIANSWNRSRFLSRIWYLLGFWKSFVMIISCISAFLDLYCLWLAKSVLDSVHHC